MTEATTVALAAAPVGAPLIGQPEEAAALVTLILKLVALMLGHPQWKPRKCPLLLTFQPIQRG